MAYSRKEWETGDVITAADMNRLEEGVDSCQSMFAYKGNCLFADLPTSGNSVNDTYYVTDKECGYTWNGSEWSQSGAYGISISQLSDEIGNLYKNDIKIYSSTSDYRILADGTISSVENYIIERYKIDEFRKIHIRTGKSGTALFSKSLNIAEKIGDVYAELTDVIVEVPNEAKFLLTSRYINDDTMFYKNKGFVDVENAISNMVSLKNDNIYSGFTLPLYKAKVGALLSDTKEIQNDSTYKDWRVNIYDVSALKDVKITGEMRGTNTCLEYGFYSSDEITQDTFISGNPMNPPLPSYDYTIDNVISVPSGATFMCVNVNPLKTIPTVSKALITDCNKKEIEEVKKLINNHWNEKSWFAYGTSITYWQSGRYVSFLKDFSGLNVTNRGNGGSGYTSYSDQRIFNRVMQIPDTIETNSDGTTNTITDGIDGQETADLITLEFGANDGSAPLGNISDNADNTTLCGALNMCIQHLQKNTDAQIVVISSPKGRRKPNYNHIIPNDPDKTQEFEADDYEWYGFEEKFLGQDGAKYSYYERNEAIRKVCLANGVPFIDLDGEGGAGWSRIRNDNNKYMKDQIHPTQLGGYNQALFIWSKLKNIPLWCSELPN